MLGHQETSLNNIPDAYEHSLQHQTENQQYLHYTTANQQNQQYYKNQLSPSQVSLLNRMLPQGYSLQIEPSTTITKRNNNINSSKATKGATKQKANKKKGKLDVQLFEEEQPSAQIADEVKIEKISRKTKSMRQIEQIENSIYSKYQNSVLQAQINRRSVYEGLDQSLKPCVKILNMLKNSKTSWPFRESVDAVAMNIPHYNQIIREPMDLSKIECNLKTHVYLTPTQFHADVNKIIQNSYTFNQNNVEYSKITSQFQQFYKRMIGASNDSTTNDIPQNQEYINVSPITKTQSKKKQSKLQSKNSKRKTEHHQYHAGSTYLLELQPITLAEKKELSANIRKLPKDAMKGIIAIVYEGETIIKDQFDLEDLPPKKIRNLQNYVRGKLLQLQKGSQQTEKSGNINKDNNPMQQSSFQINSDDDS